MPNQRFIQRNLNEIYPVPTAHNIGLKSVLLGNAETISNITQIAMTELHRGEEVESHVHQTMDEHYLFVSSEGVMAVDNEEVECRAGLFLLIPATSVHSIRAITDMKFLTIGVAL